MERSRLITPRTFARNGWTLWHLVGALVMLAIGTAATAPVWREMGRTAVQHGEVEHLLLVPLVATYLIWVRRERIRLCHPGGAWIGPVVVIGGLLSGLIGGWGSFEVLEHAGALAIVLGCFLAVVGRGVLWQFLPAFAVLLLVIPTPGVIHKHVLYPFYDAVADLSLILYHLLGIEAYRRGAVLTVAGQEVPAVAAWGAPGLKAIFVVAYGLAFSQPLRVWVRLLILASTPLAAVVCQLLGTLIVAGLSRIDRVDPDWLFVFSGYLLLPVVFGVLAGLVRLLQWAAVPVRYYTLASDA